MTKKCGHDSVMKRRKAIKTTRERHAKLGYNILTKNPSDYRGSNTILGSLVLDLSAVGLINLSIAALYRKNIICIEKSDTVRDISWLVGKRS